MLITTAVFILFTHYEIQQLSAVELEFHPDTHFRLMRKHNPVSQTLPNDGILLLSCDEDIECCKRTNLKELCPYVTAKNFIFVFIPICPGHSKKHGTNETNFASYFIKRKNCFKITKSFLSSCEKEVISHSLKRESILLRTIVQDKVPLPFITNKKKFSRQFLKELYHTREHLLETENASEKYFKIGDKYFIPYFYTLPVLCGNCCFKYYGKYDISNSIMKKIFFNRCKSSKICFKKSFMIDLCIISCKYAIKNKKDLHMNMRSEQAAELYELILCNSSSKLINKQSTKEFLIIKCSKNKITSYDNSYNCFINHLNHINKSKRESSKQPINLRCWCIKRPYKCKNKLSQNDSLGLRNYFTKFTVRNKRQIWKRNPNYLPLEENELGRTNSFDRNLHNTTTHYISSANVSFLTKYVKNSAKKLSTGSPMSKERNIKSSNSSDTLISMGHGNEKTVLNGTNNLTTIPVHNDLSTKERYLLMAYNESLSGTYAKKYHIRKNYEIPSSFTSKNPTLSSKSHFKDNLKNIYYLNKFRRNNSTVNAVDASNASTKREFSFHSPNVSKIGKLSLDKISEERNKTATNDKFSTRATPRSYSVNSNINHLLTTLKNEEKRGIDSKELDDKLMHKSNETVDSTTYIYDSADTVLSESYNNNPHTEPNNFNQAKIDDESTLRKETSDNFGTIYEDPITTFSNNEPKITETKVLTDQMNKLTTMNLPSKISNINSSSNNSFETTFINDDISNVHGQGFEDPETNSATEELEYLTYKENTDSFPTAKVNKFISRKQSPLTNTENYYFTNNLISPSQDKITISTSLNEIPNEYATLKFNKIFTQKNKFTNNPLELPRESLLKSTTQSSSSKKDRDIFFLETFDNEITETDKIATTENLHINNYLTKFTDIPETESVSIKKDNESIRKNIDQDIIQKSSSTLENYFLTPFQSTSHSAVSVTSEYSNIEKFAKEMQPDLMTSYVLFSALSNYSTVLKKLGTEEQYNTENVRDDVTKKDYSFTKSELISSDNEILKNSPAKNVEFNTFTNKINSSDDGFMSTENSSYPSEMEIFSHKRNKSEIEEITKLSDERLYDETQNSINDKFVFPITNFSTTNDLTYRDNSSNGSRNDEGTYQNFSLSEGNVGSQFDEGRTIKRELTRNSEKEFLLTKENEFSSKIPVSVMVTALLGEKLSVKKDKGRFSNKQVNQQYFTEKDDKTLINRIWSTPRHEISLTSENNVLLKDKNLVNLLNISHVTDIFPLKTDTFSIQTKEVTKYEEKQNKNAFSSENSLTTEMLDLSSDVTSTYTDKDIFPSIKSVSTNKNYENFNDTTQVSSDKNLFTSSAESDYITDVKTVLLTTSRNKGDSNFLQNNTSGRRTVDESFSSNISLTTEVVKAKTKDYINNKNETDIESHTSIFNEDFKPTNKTITSINYEKSKISRHDENAIVTSSLVTRLFSSDFPPKENFNFSTNSEITNPEKELTRTERKVRSSTHRNKPLPDSFFYDENSYRDTRNKSTVLINQLKTTEESKSASGMENILPPLIVPVKRNNTTYKSVSNTEKSLLVTTKNYTMSSNNLFTPQISTTNMSTNLTDIQTISSSENNNLISSHVTTKRPPLVTDENKLSVTVVDSVEQNSSVYKDITKSTNPRSAEMPLLASTGESTFAINDSVQQEKRTYESTTTIIKFKATQRPVRVTTSHNLSLINKSNQESDSKHESITTNKKLITTEKTSFVFTLENSPSINDSFKLSKTTYESSTKSIKLRTSTTISTKLRDTQKPAFVNTEDNKLLLTGNSFQEDSATYQSSKTTDVLNVSLSSESEIILPSESNVTSPVYTSLDEHNTVTEYASDSSRKEISPSDRQTNFSTETAKSSSLLNEITLNSKEYTSTVNTTFRTEKDVLSSSDNNQDFSVNIDTETSDIITEDESTIHVSDELIRAERDGLSSTPGMMPSTTMDVNKTEMNATNFLENTNGLNSQNNNFTFSNGNNFGKGEYEISKEDATAKSTTTAKSNMNVSLDISTETNFVKPSKGFNVEVDINTELNTNVNDEKRENKPEITGVTDISTTYDISNIKTNLDISTEDNIIITEEGTSYATELSFNTKSYTDIVNKTVEQKNRINVFTDMSTTDEINTIYNNSDISDENYIKMSRNDTSSVTDVNINTDLKPDMNTKIIDHKDETKNQQEIESISTVRQVLSSSEDSQEILDNFTVREDDIINEDKGKTDHIEDDFVPTEIKIFSSSQEIILNVTSMTDKKEVNRIDVLENPSTKNNNLTISIDNSVGLSDNERSTNGITDKTTINFITSEKSTLSSTEISFNTRLNTVVDDEVFNQEDETTIQDEESIRTERKLRSSSEVIPAEVNPTHTQETDTNVIQKENELNTYKTNFNKPTERSLISETLDVPLDNISTVYPNGEANSNINVDVSLSTIFDQEDKTTIQDKEPISTERKIRSSSEVIPSEVNPTDTQETDANVFQKENELNTNKTDFNKSTEKSIISALPNVTFGNVSDVYPNGEADSNVSINVDISLSTIFDQEDETTIEEEEPIRTERKIRLSSEEVISAGVNPTETQEADTSIFQKENELNTYKTDFNKPTEISLISVTPDLPLDNISTVYPNGEADSNVNINVDVSLSTIFDQEDETTIEDEEPIRTERKIRSSSEEVISAGVNPTETQEADRSIFQKENELNTYKTDFNKPTERTLISVTSDMPLDDISTVYPNGETDSNISINVDISTDLNFKTSTKSNSNPSSDTNSDVAEIEETSKEFERVSTEKVSFGTVTEIFKKLTTAMPVPETKTQGQLLTTTIEEIITIPQIVRSSIIPKSSSSDNGNEDFKSTTTIVNDKNVSLRPMNTESEIESTRTQTYSEKYSLSTPINEFTENKTDSKFISTTNFPVPLTVHTSTSRILKSTMASRSSLNEQSSTPIYTTTMLLSPLPFHFTIDSDYDETVGTRKKEFEENLSRQLVVAMRIPFECLQNMEVSKGSIEVNFDLVSNPQLGHIGDEKALKAAAAELKRMIDNGQLKISDLDGNSLIVVPIDPPTKAPVVNQSEHTTLILGVVIGAFILTVISVAIAAIIIKRKANGIHRLTPIEEVRSKLPSYREIPFQEALFMKGPAKNKLILGKYCYNTGKWLGPGPEPMSFVPPESVVYRPPTDSEVSQTPRPPTAVRERLRNDWELDWDSMVFSR